MERDSGFANGERKERDLVPLFPCWTALRSGAFFKPPEDPEGVWHEV